MKIKIIGGGRGCGKTQSELARALEKLEKQKFVNKCLLAKTLNLESENARLKADMKEIADRDLQIAEEANLLSDAYKREHERYKCLLLLIKKAIEEIEALKPNNPSYRYYHSEIRTIDKVIEVMDNYGFRKWGTQDER